MTTTTPTASTPHSNSKFSIHWIKKLQSFSDRNWYAPLVALFAGLDSFIFFVPIEALLIPSILLKPKRWFTTGVLVALGSAIGAVALAYVVSKQGEAYVGHFFPRLLHSPSWEKSQKFMDAHGWWALTAVAAGPTPQQPAVIFSALVHTRLITIFLSVLAGRGAKYLVVCKLAAFAPSLFKKKKKAA